MFKRKFGIMVALSLVITLFSGLCVEAETVYLLNGDFETLEEKQTSGGTNYNWSSDWSAACTAMYYDVEEGVNVYSDTTVKRSGNASMKMVNTTPEGKKFRVWQEIKNLTAGKYYDASAWVRIPSAINPGVWLRVGENVNVGESGSFLVTSNESYRVTNTNDCWVQIIARFQAPAAKRLYIVLELGMPCAVPVYWDDVSVCETTGIETGFETPTTEKYSDTKDFLWESGWTRTYKSGFNSDCGESYEITADDKHSGSYALKMTTKAASNSCVAKDIYNLTPGKAYKISCWVKTTISTTTSNCPKLYVYPTANAAASANLGWARKYGAAAMSWASMYVVFTAPSNGHVSINLEMGLAEGAFTYWDDIQLSESGFTFTKNNLPLTAIEPGTVSIHASYLNGGKVAASATVIIALYELCGTNNDINMLVSPLQVVVLTADYGLEKTGDYTVEVPDDGKKYVIKAFMWDSLTSLSPYIEDGVLS